MARTPHPMGRLAIRVAVIALALAPLAAAVPRLLSREEPAPPAVPPGAPPPTLTGPEPVLGMAIVAHHISDLPLYLESVDRIAELGANALVVVTPMFQRHVDSSTIRFLPDRCPTDRQLVAILRRARERGLRTSLQPIVLIQRPGKKDWRGLIRPEDWDRWWAGYDRLIDRFLAIAIEAKVDMLVVGSELNTTEDQIDRWRRVVGRVREAFDGQIAYSANWDRYDKVALWPLVDVMSVSAYFELRRDEPDAPEAALADDWRLHRDRMLALAERWDMPLLLSEIGYPSLPWASAHPWNYVTTGDVRADHEAQARSYRAFFTAWTEAVTDPDGRAEGFFCYHWDPYHHGEDDDTGYGILGKPSHEVIRQGFRRIRAAAAATTSAPAGASAP